MSTTAEERAEAIAFHGDECDKENCFFHCLIAQVEQLERERDALLGVRLEGSTPCGCSYKVEGLGGEVQSGNCKLNAAVALLRVLVRYERILPQRHDHETDGTCELCTRWEKAFAFIDALAKHKEAGG